MCRHDVQAVSFLQNCFTFGFPSHFSGPRVSFCAKNLASSYQNPEIVSAKLDKELQAHRIAGLFKAPSFHTFRVSPLTKGIKCATHFILLSRSAKADLSMWKSFLVDFNGRSFFSG